MPSVGFPSREKEARFHQSTSQFDEHLARHFNSRFSLPLHGVPTIYSQITSAFFRANRLAPNSGWTRAPVKVL